MQRNSQKESRAMSQASGEIVQILKVRINIIISYILYYIYHHIDLKHLLTCILQPVCWAGNLVFFWWGVANITQQRCRIPRPGWANHWVLRSLGKCHGAMCQSPLTHPKKNVENWMMSFKLMILSPKKRGPVHILLPDKKKKNSFVGCSNQKKWDSVFQFTSFSPHLVHLKHPILLTTPSISTSGTPSNIWGKPPSQQQLLWPWSEWLVVVIGEVVDHQNSSNIQPSINLQSKAAKFAAFDFLKDSKKNTKFRKFYLLQVFHGTFEFNIYMTFRMQNLTLLSSHHSSHLVHHLSSFIHSFSRSVSHRQMKVVELQCCSKFSVSPSHDSVVCNEKNHWKIVVVASFAG